MQCHAAASAIVAAGGAHSRRWRQTLHRWYWLDRVHPHYLYVRVQERLALHVGSDGSVTGLQYDAETPGGCLPGLPVAESQLQVHCRADRCNPKDRQIRTAGVGSTVLLLGANLARLVMGVWSESMIDLVQSSNR